MSGPDREPRGSVLRWRGRPVARSVRSRRRRTIHVDVQLSLSGETTWRQKIFRYKQERQTGIIPNSPDPKPRRRKLG